MIKANEQAIAKLQASDPVLVDVLPLHQVKPEIPRNLFLHAGPPIAFEDMCEPMKGAVICATMYEGFADTPAEALSVIQAGKIEFSPCHEYQVVGPMTGLTTYSMPVWVVEDRNTKQRAFANIAEGNGLGIRFGEHTPQTLERLHWIREVAAPVFGSAVRELAPIDLGPIMAQGLAMGDELHMRNHATTSLFLKMLCPLIAKYADDRAEEILRFVASGNDQFFLNLAMASNKLAADAAAGIEGSTIVTCLARNGVEVGVKISGLPNRWFTAPAPMVKGLYFPGRTEEDANPDLGDSAIMEVGGFGGCSMITSPAIIKFLGADSVDIAFETTDKMYQIAESEHPRYQIPIYNFRGIPSGLDAMKIVETGITPILNTAIASNKAGVGMVGAGMSVLPIEPFAAALKALAKELGI